MYDLTQTSTGLQSYQEALQVGRLIQHWLKHEQVIDRNAQGSFLRRPVPSDFFILMRSKTHIRQIERAFLDLQLPCQSPRKGGLLKTLEAADIQALLNFLLMPSNQLALAHVLRSPIFQCTEVDLEYLARDQTGKTWWQKLQDAPSKCLQNAAKLLQDWLALAGRLPVHDLLDRIYAQGRVMEVYAATAPPLMRAKVLANLEAFLHLALDIHGGRYPSLSRMIDELARLNQGDDEESPDEGESNALELEGVEEEGLEGGEEEMDTEMDVDMETEVPAEPEVPAEMAEEMDMGDGEEFVDYLFSDVDENEEMNEEDDYMSKVEEMIEGMFTESKVDSVLKKYFKTSDNEKMITESKKQKLSKKLESVCESKSQLMVSKKLVNKYPNAKLVGKTVNKNLVFESNNRKIRVTKDGQIL